MRLFLGALELLMQGSKKSHHLNSVSCSLSDWRVNKLLPEPLGDLEKFPLVISQFWVTCPYVLWKIKQQMNPNDGSQVSTGTKVETTEFQITIQRWKPSPVSRSCLKVQGNPKLLLHNRRERRAVISLCGGNRQQFQKSRLVAVGGLEKESREWEKRAQSSP